MNEELARLKRRVRRLEQSRRNWKERVAQKQAEIRYLRVNVRDLTASRQLWKQRALDSSSPPPDEPPILLPLPPSNRESPLGEP